MDNRQPTSLVRLAEIAEDPKLADPEEVQGWLMWTLCFLESRKLYHKKSYVKKAILQKMAEQLLSADELAAIDAEAERQLAGSEQPVTLSDKDMDTIKNMPREELEARLLEVRRRQEERELDHENS